MTVPHIRDPNPSSDALVKSATRLKSWCAETALPVWAERAQKSDGSWVEHLKLDGTADLAAERRWRVLARQVYVYAKASAAGWYEGQAVAESTYLRMRELGPVHRVNMAGEITDPMRDLYDHAFYILAASSLYGLTRNSSYLADAEALLDWIDANLAHSAGGWQESNLASLTDMRRQNPHMHLLEASLFLHGITEQRKHLRYAEGVMILFETHFFDAGTIIEFFTSNWVPKTGEIGQTSEPGHAMEWVWLLAQYTKATGKDCSEFQDQLYGRAMQNRGWFLNDEETKSGEIKRETKRLWVQTEVIKAHLAMAERDVAGAREMAAATIDALFPIYLTSEGLWNDQINACDANVASTIPVSTFYHILCMAIEADRVANA